jgi:hypothetical protein
MTCPARYVTRKMPNPTSIAAVCAALNDEANDASRNGIE